MALREVLEAFKKGYKDCYGLSDIKKAENHNLHTDLREELTDFDTEVNGFEVYAVNKDGEDVPFKIAFSGEELVNLNSEEEYFMSKEDYLAPFKEWNPELTFKIKWF